MTFHDETLVCLDFVTAAVITLQLPQDLRLSLKLRKSKIGSQLIFRSEIFGVFAS